MGSFLESSESYELGELCYDLGLDLDLDLDLEELELRLDEDEAYRFFISSRALFLLGSPLFYYCLDCSLLLFLMSELSFENELAIRPSFSALANVAASLILSSYYFACAICFVC